MSVSELRPLCNNFLDNRFPLFCEQAWKAEGLFYDVSNNQADHPADPFAGCMRAFALLKGALAGLAGAFTLPAGAFAGLELGPHGCYHVAENIDSRFFNVQR